MRIDSDILYEHRFDAAIEGGGLIPVTLAADSDSLLRIELGVNRDVSRRDKAKGQMANFKFQISNDLPDFLFEVERQIREYFLGERRVFDVPHRLAVTPFTRKVLLGAAAVPYGETWSYLELARVTHTARHVRAVGQALGRNPLPLIYPCHRIWKSGIGEEGFAFGVLLKRQLVDLERGSHPQITNGK